MKKIIIVFGLVAVLGTQSCMKKDGISQDTSFVTGAAAAANLNKIFDISTDNSGSVRIIPTGEGAASYTVQFGHGTGAASSATVLPGNNATHVYPEGNYTVTIITKSINGSTTTTTYPLAVVYRAPENLVPKITANLHEVKVSATASYAANYTVYFGDVANEVGTPLASGAEVAHTYATANTYNIKVVANSGGAAKTEKTTAFTVFDSFAFPVTFDLSTQDYSGTGTFGGGQGFAVVDNPSSTGINTSAKVGKFTRGFEMWSGTYTPLQTPLNLSAGKKIRVWVYNPSAALIGKKLNVELEKGSLTTNIANGVAVLKMPLTTSGAWEELVFDFSTITALPANALFGQLVLRFDDGTDGSTAVIYVDNFRQTN